MAEQLQRALRDVRETLLAEPVSPRVETPREINLHYCQYVAETVAERVGDDLDVRILRDGGGGHVHTWIRYDGRHYDAECVEGVDDHHDLPFFQRHPEAAVRVEAGSADQADLRRRGEGKLYPVGIGGGSSDPEEDVDRTDYRKFVVAGVVLGLVLVVVGVAGEWAVHNHVARLPSSLGVLFYDIELIGELLVLVSPVVFYLLLPAHRSESRRSP